MLAPTAPARQVAPWQRLLADAVSSPTVLLDRLALTPADLGRELGDEAAQRLARAQFPLRVPHGYVARMRPGDPRDPLLRQVLPLGIETADLPGFGADPLQERAATAVPGILHKYHGRLLLLVTGACAIHCRYCFRRHFPYGEHTLDPVRRAEALAYLAAHPEVDEVILSGGDPLAVTDDKLAALAAELAAIPHLARLRVHTRLPVVLPERVDDHLLAWLAGGRLAPVMVIHANHPNEIDATVLVALDRLRRAGVTLLNQSVLLAGVNDDAGVLAELSRRLFGAGVLPYYLHLLDRVAGAAHFDVPAATGRALVASLRDLLPGYLVPRLVREVPGAPAKSPVP